MIGTPATLEFWGGGRKKKIINHQVWSSLIIKEIKSTQRVKKKVFALSILQSIRNRYFTIYVG